MIIECRAIQAANEARVSQDFLLGLFLRTEISERIDDDTKDHVEDDDDDDEVEEEVVDHADHEQWLLDQLRNGIQV